MSDEVINLRALIRDILTACDEADPGVIAEAVIVRIPDEELRDALHQTMRYFVRQIISELRIANSPQPGPITGPMPARARSAKNIAIRQDWQSRLHDRVHVGGSEWKLLRDCTYDDLMAVARERSDLALRNALWADTYEGWASLLASHRVAVFGDLPASVLETALSRAA